MKYALRSSLLAAVASVLLAVRMPHPPAATPTGSISTTELTSAGGEAANSPEQTAPEDGRKGRERQH